MGVPSASLNEGSTLALAASVSDSDSAFFTYAWSVTRGETDVASGTGPALAAYLADQGIYTVTLTVFDESGNSDTKTAAVVVNNAAPVLNPTAFDTGSALLTGSGSTDNLGSAIAVGNGYVLTGTPLSDSGATDAGTASLGMPDGTVTPLAAPTATANARFGSAVAIVGNYAIVGAPSDGSAAGTVSVFDLTTGTFQRAITGPNAAVGDKFGSSVAPLGGFVAIGARAVRTAERRRPARRICSTRRPATFFRRIAIQVRMPAMRLAQRGRGRR